MRKALTLLFSTSSFLLLVYGILYHNPVFTGRVIYDYILWASTLLSLLAVYRDVREYWDKPALSTSLWSIAGGVLVVLGRIMSLYYNSYAVFGYIGALVGEPYTIEGFTSSLLVLVGSVMVVMATAVHAFIGEAIVAAWRPTISELYTSLSKITHRIIGFLNKHPLSAIVLTAIFAFTYRFIPELEWWPWLIGWDTPEYAAHLLDFAERLNPFTSYYWMGVLRNTPPLLNMLLVLFTKFTDAWLIFKIYPSIAYAALASLSSAVAMKVYGKTWRTGLLAGLLTSIYILNLRISWDYHRQLLGSITMLATILALEKSIPKTPKQAFIALLLLATCGLSHEVTGLAGFTLSLTLTYTSLRARYLTGAAAGLAGVIVNTLLEVWYWKAPYTVVGTYILPVGLVPAIDAAPQTLSYLIAGYGFTIPLVLVAMSRHRKTYVSATFIVLLLAGVSPLIAPYSSVAVWYRFLIGVAPLVSTLAAVGAVEAIRDRRLVAVYLLITALPGLGFTYGYNLMGFYVSSLREFPSSLTPWPASTICLETYEFFRNSSVGDAVIIAWCELARYVHLAIRNPDSSRLIWIWRPLSNTSIYAIINNIKAEKVVIVWPNINLNSTSLTCISSIKPVNEKTQWIYIATVAENRTESRSLSGR
jgi:hypothetical protein